MKQNTHILSNQRHGMDNFSNSICAINSGLGQQQRQQPASRKPKHLRSISEATEAAHRSIGSFLFGSQFVFIVAELCMKITWIDDCFTIENWDMNSRIDGGTESRCNFSVNQRRSTHTHTHTCGSWVPFMRSDANGCPSKWPAKRNKWFFGHTKPVCNAILHSPVSLCHQTRARASHTTKTVQNFKSNRTK